MKTNCVKYNDCRKPVQACNSKCQEYEREGVVVNEVKIIEKPSIIVREKELNEWQDGWNDCLEYSEKWIDGLLNNMLSETELAEIDYTSHLQEESLPSLIHSHVKKHLKGE